jgi:RNA polymerase sigma-70 factor (ECF subfamily)
MPSADDLEAIHAALAGADGAMDALAVRYLPVVLGWARRLGGARVQADDVAHDAWMVVLRKLSSVRDPQAFESWLYGIVRRVVAAHRRKAWFRKWVGGEVPDQADPAAGPEEDVQRAAMARTIARGLEELRPHHREIIVLCDLEERPDSEVSALLGVPKGTVKSRLRRARKELRGHLEALRD